MKIKIAVAVNAEGEWYAYGEYCVSETYLLRFVPERLIEGPTTHVVWVTADVPLPQVLTVEGEVDVQTEAEDAGGGGN